MTALRFGRPQPYRADALDAGRPERSKGVNVRQPVQASRWYDEAVLYHIYPLSFADTNGDGFGDLTGIINHLDYLGGDADDALGVTAIWLSPIFCSPMADWGYDVTDYRAIDPRFGTMADFERLVSAVHERGMKLLLDFVPNHTSSEHDWFKASRRSRLSAKRDWYIWADPKPDGSPPSNWLARFGGSAWTFDDATGQYYLHSFLPSQPDLNWRNPAVRAAMEDVLRFWLAKGVDGFRTDAVMSLFKDQHLRDDPVNPEFIAGSSNPSDRFLPVYSAMSEDVGPVLDSLCEVLMSTQNDHLLMSEAYLDIAGMAKLYRACDAHPVHAPFNFNLIHLPWSAQTYRAFIDEYEASLRAHDLPNYVLGNHDQHRLVARLGPDRARLAAMLQLTLRGLPVIYYGDELGLPDAKRSHGQGRDPWNVQIHNQASSRDAERAPMPWSEGAGAGFTTGKPWLPLVDNADTYSVARQSRAPESTLSLYRHLIHLRRRLPALSRGNYGAIDCPNDSVYAFVRKAGVHHVIVVLNFSDQATGVELEFTGRCIASTRNVEGDGSLHDGGRLELGGYEGRIYEGVRQ